MINREEQLKTIIKQMLTPLKNIPLDIIIESICGHTIFAYDGYAKKKIIQIVDSSGLSINKKGIRSKRPNEIGNYCEPFVISAIHKLGYIANTPQTISGKKRSAGYPDIEALIENKPFYIEIKSYDLTTKSSSLRSFYLSPSRDFKVTKDAYHLIFAYEMKQVKTGLFKTSRCTVLDARNLLCDVKYEFNSDNKRMYEESHNLFIFERIFD